jgi:hypothetical protein
VHIKALERHNLLDRYVSNFLACKEKGFNIIANEVAYPLLLNEVEKYKGFFEQKGIELNFGSFVGNYDKKCYPRAYSEEEIRIFGLDNKSNLGIERFYQKGKLCNAGYNVGIVDIFGNVRVCDESSVKIGNVYKKIKFKKELITCPFEICACPVNICDRFLFEKAMEENKKIRWIPSRI